MTLHCVFVDLIRSQMIYLIPSVDSWQTEREGRTESWKGVKRQREESQFVLSHVSLRLIITQIRSCFLLIRSAVGLDLFREVDMHKQTRRLPCAQSDFKADFASGGHLQYTHTHVQALTSVCPCVLYTFLSLRHDASIFPLALHKKKKITRHTYFFHFFGFNFIAIYSEEKKKHNSLLIFQS